MSVSHLAPNFPRPTKGATTSRVFYMPSSPPLAIGDKNNESNILELSFYRKQQQRSSWRYDEKLALRGGSSRSIKLASQFWHSGSNKNYMERMKTYAAIFAFLTFFVAAGVWLMNGLEQSFGPLH